MALVLLPGCGGGGGGGTPLTKEEYASKADAICGKYNQQTKSLGNPSNLSGLAKVADKTLSILDKAIADLKKLKPPASEKATADQWMTQVENLKSDLAEIRDKAKANDTPGVQAVLPKAQDHNSKSNELASRLGMSVCNQD
ncbi:MAG: hypothetical protein QOF27_2147 [Gaiellaceae bacterium]|jgi:hypothetical protein|nr:hypothetical protein [Gaiellaceae bacterium]